MLMDVFAHQIHADGGADGGDIVGAQQRHHLRQGLQHILLRDNNLGVLSPQVVRHLLGILQIDGVNIHADGEGLDGLFQIPGRHGAHQAGIQAAGKQKAHRDVGVQPLDDTRLQLVVDLAAGGLHVVVDQGDRLADIPVADELFVHIIVPRRERQNAVAQAHQVLRLAGEDDLAALQIAIVQRADADGVPGGNQLLLCAVIDDQGKLRIQHAEHVGAVLPVQRQQQLAV